MSGGVFAIDRGVFAHPVFAPEPFTEREAWMWLISEAAWKPRRIRVRRGVIDLQRGQLAHATRFMASRWQWSEARVRRFLNRLKNDAMVDVQADALATRVTICNYDKFQKVSLPSDARPTHESTHGRRTSDAKKKAGRNAGEDFRPSDESPARPDDAKAAVAIYNAAAAECGWPICQKLASQRRAAVNARLQEAGGIPGWQAAIDKAKASGFLRGDNDRGWRPDFDFFSRAKSFAKLVEGSYDDRTPGESRAGNGKQHASETILRSIARAVEKRTRAGGGEADADDRARHFGPEPQGAGIVADDLEIPAILRRY